MRKKKVPRRTETKKRICYKPDVLLSAWKAVESGMTIYQASKLFGIPKQTLRDRKKGKIQTPENSGCGRHPVFAKRDEETLVNHIIYLATVGYGFSRAEVVSLATDYSHFLGVLPLDKSFTDGWLTRFFRRWPKLKLIRERSSELYQAKCCTPEALKTYFTELKKVMDKYDLHEKPHCIYNMNETVINTEYKPGKVIVLKGSRPGPTVTTSSRSATVTVIACGNAVGTWMPPFLIFKGKNKKTELSDRRSTDTEVRMSESGWCNGVLFMDFVENHFVNFSMGSDSDYKLLLYDGHSVHINTGMIEMAREQKVILFVLPPHTSDTTETLDVGCHGAFKRQLLMECLVFMKEKDTETISQDDLGEIIYKVYPKALSAQNLMLSFTKSGIYPFNMGDSDIDNNQLSAASD